MHCEIAKEKFTFSLLSTMMKRQMEKYRITDEGGILISSEIVSSIEIPSSEKKYQSKYYDIFEEGEKIIQIQKDEEGHRLGAVIYQPKEALILMEPGNIARKEYLLSEYATLFYILRDQKAIMIHSSSIAYREHGILFIAKSGTGKSTQARLWREHLGIEQINDDKNIIVEEDGELWIYGNPYSGKSLIDVNKKVRLTDLVFIYQSEENTVKEVSKKEEFLYLMPHITNSSFMYDRKKWDHLTNRLMEVRGFLLGCDISYEAVDILKEKLEVPYESQ